MKKTFFIFIICLSPVLYCSDSETVDLIPDQEYSEEKLLVNTVIKEKASCHYSCCPKTYNNYSCTDRGCDSVIGILPACACLGIREMITDCGVWTRNGSISFVQAHEKIWCSRDVWFPCCCDTSKEVCTSAVVNCSTGVTIASIAYGLCLFLPCITKKGCTFIKKKK